MDSKYVIIGIVVGIFFVGMGLSYVIFGQVSVEPYSDLRQLEIDDLLNDKDFREDLMSRIVNHKEIREDIIQEIIQNEEFLKEIMVDQDFWNMMKTQFEMGDESP